MQASILDFIHKDAKALQMGLLNMGGGQLRGWQLSGINYMTEASGLQVGGINATTKLEGLQIGLINYTHQLAGLQIGVINVATRAPLKFFPILNAAW